MKRTQTLLAVGVAIASFHTVPAYAGSDGQCSRVAFLSFCHDRALSKAPLDSFRDGPKPANVLPPAKEVDLVTEIVIDQSADGDSPDEVEKVSKKAEKAAAKAEMGWMPLSPQRRRNAPRL